MLQHDHGEIIQNFPSGDTSFFIPPEKQFVNMDF